MSKEKPLAVLYRWDIEDKSPVAIFPTIAATVDGSQLQCYAHVGQHSGASLDWLRDKTRPATEAEYAPLARELRRVGYKSLRAVKRISQSMRAEMLASARSH